MARASRSSRFTLYVILVIAQKRCQLSFDVPERRLCAPPPTGNGLDALPDCVLRLHVLPLLRGADKKALRLAAVEVFDCQDATLADDTLAGFLGSTGPQILSQIHAVDVKRCHYVGRPLLAFLRSSCPALRRLSASRWTDSITLAAICRLAALEELDLSHADGLDDGGLAALTTLPRLRSLTLAGCRWVGDAGCATLAKITTLEALSLAGTAAGPAALDHLSALPRLRRLDLSGCARIDGDALSCVARISSLEALELRDPGGAVGAAGLRHVAALPRLRELDLGARFVVDDAAAEGLAACRALTSLSVGSFTLLRAPTSAFGTSLRRLAFGGGAASKGLELLPPLPRLEALHITGVDTVTDRVMAAMSRHTTLTEVSLRGGYTLTKAGLACLLALPNLASLLVVSCPAAGGAALDAFAAQHPRLRTAASVHAAGVSAAA
ncbi:hypothetical protein MNEG_4431 [Monoraphidium neglectum]|uniref:Uncharacterized protein n=1 Tax=Monoraphidium neglectum TaxID=145388 RepID=A0A0D2L9P8_9CHLO|nr:hypothetical protein MNEG_4431 [Monoraphidium neglectum]KIZ03529.1 hypothetical protein MNEG_4431 [Monoraphidium neglectum]|eukprot:XP_013902548.1 hypothetical protein MNEG_4431 [Monoraphidium neglectum]